MTRATITAALTVTLYSAAALTALAQTAPGSRPARAAAPAAAPLPQLYPDIQPALSLEQLKAVAIENATIESVTQSPDGSVRVTAIVSHPPAHDRVQVWIGLPAKWNGRFQGTGGGGWLGGNAMGVNGPLAQGFAAGATDTGHSGFNGTFGLDAAGQSDMPAILDNAYRGIHDMTVVGKALTAAYYGKPPKYSYFVGFSTGGRQGLSEAQRYPDDYDGITSGCPAINWPRMVTSSLWARAVMEGANNVVPAAKLRAASQAFVEACDEVDGVKDGVVEDPSRCDFDPHALVGKQVGGSEFTAADADVLQKIWDGPRTSDGKFLWYGLAKGADLNAMASQPLSIASEWVRYFVLKDPKWDAAKVSPAEFERVFAKGQQDWADVFATDNADLTKFRDRGGKIVITHGWADQLIPTGGTIDYYDRLTKQMGGRDETMKFARLFLIPAAGHGVGGTDGGASAVIRWVEQGIAPDRLINRTARGTRPLFPYPAHAKYTGTGSTDDAANFVEEMPTR